MNDLNLLKVFEAVISTGSVNEAANKLNITPPAVSQSLNKLRDRYADPLFIREGRGLKATHYAKELYDKIKEPLAILMNSADIHSEFDPDSSTRTFKIATQSDLDLLFFSDIFNKIKEKAPNAKIELITDFSDEESLQNILRLRKVDLIVSTTEMEDKSYNNEIIKEEEVVITGRVGHPAIKNNTISFDDFFAAEQTASKMSRQSTFTLNSLSKINLPKRNIVYTSDSMFNILLISSQTDLLSVSIKSFVKKIEKMGIVEMCEPPFECNKLPIYMTWHKTFDKDAGMSWIKNLIKDNI